MLANHHSPVLKYFHHPRKLLPLCFPLLSFWDTKHISSSTTFLLVFVSYIWHYINLKHVCRKHTDLFGVWGRWLKYLLRKRPFGCAGAGAQPARGKWFHLSLTFHPVLPCPPPPVISGPFKARAFPSALLGLVSLLRSPKLQEGIAPPHVVILPVLQNQPHE